MDQARQCPGAFLILGIDTLRDFGTPKLETSGQVDVVSQCPKRTEGNIEKMKVIALGTSSATFDNIARR